MGILVEFLQFFFPFLAGETGGGAYAPYAPLKSASGMFNYIFPPFRLLAQNQDGWLQDHSYCSGRTKTFFVSGDSSVVCLPLREDIFSQFKGRKLYQGLEKLNLHAWLRSGIPSDREDFLKMQPNVYWEQFDCLPEQSTTPNSQYFALDVCKGKLIRSEYLLK